MTLSATLIGLACWAVTLGLYIYTHPKFTGLIVNGNRAWGWTEGYLLGRKIFWIGFFGFEWRSA